MKLHFIKYILILQDFKVTDLNGYQLLNALLIEFPFRSLVFRPFHYRSFHSFSSIDHLLTHCAGVSVRTHVYVFVCGRCGGNDMRLM